MPMVAYSNAVYKVESSDIYGAKTSLPDGSIWYGVEKA